MRLVSRGTSCTAHEPCFSLTLAEFNNENTNSIASRMLLDAYHNKTSQVLTSTTKELQSYYGERRVEVRSDKTQAVIGFVEGQQVNLPSVEPLLRRPLCR